MQVTVSSLARDAELPRQAHDVLLVLEGPCHQGVYLLFRKALFPSFIFAPLFGKGDALSLALPDEGALEFGHGTDDLQMKALEW